MNSGLVWIMAAVVGSMLFYEYSAIFCNAMLPNIAPREIGFWSGMGFALGNAFGVVLFLFFLFAWSWNPHPLFGLDKALHEPERAVGILASVWMLVFGLPLFFFTPDSAATKLSAGTTIRKGLKNLLETLTRIRNYRNVGVFLIARMTYNEGFVVLMSFSGIYAAGVLHWSAEALIVQGLLNSVAAGPRRRPGGLDGSEDRFTPQRHDLRGRIAAGHCHRMLDEPRHGPLHQAIPAAAQLRRHVPHHSRHRVLHRAGARGNFCHRRSVLQPRAHGETRPAGHAQ
ncbi:MAG: MFS transporter [Steroidobacteraceae bacterium]